MITDRGAVPANASSPASDVPDADEPGLVRYWFTFDVDHLGPEPGPPGTTILDGGTYAHRFCGRGVGVTGYAEADCLSLIEGVLQGEPVPPVRSRVRDVDIDTLSFAAWERVGVPVWRGIWYPAHNLRGPSQLGDPA